jgi:hypothetical protein
VIRRQLLAVGCLGSLAALRAQRAAAEPQHAGLRATIGPPGAPYAMPGLDARRSRTSRTRLGAKPRVERRLRVAFGVGRGLVTFEDGSFFVLHPSARASRFDARGKLVHSLKLALEATSAPVVTSAGLTAFLEAGELVFVDENGRTRQRSALSGDPELTARSILAARDGGVVLATSGMLFKVSAFGELVWRKSSPEPVLELLETAAGLLSVSTSGSVFGIDQSGRLSKLGELGGAANAVTASEDGQLLLARTGSHRLVVFDLQARRPRASIEDATLELDGPVLFSKERLAQAFTGDGLLVRYRPDGSEAQRIPVDPGAHKAPGMDHVLLLADGRLLLSRAGADVAIITAAGEVTDIADSACADPLGVLAAGPNAVLLACRSGNVLRLE